MLSATGSKPELWRDRQSVDGFRVQDRDVPGLAYKELRISAVSQKDVESLCHAVLAEESDRPEGRFKRREVLRETATDRWVYEQVSVPILRDRDYVDTSPARAATLRGPLRDFLSGRRPSRAAAGPRHRPHSV